MPSPCVKSDEGPVDEIVTDALENSCPCGALSWSSRSNKSSFIHVVDLVRLDQDRRLRLRTLPLTGLKFDKSFIDTVNTDPPLRSSSPPS
ncbi:MAG: hypothetical protein JWQ07_5291 [Ramlibacter sp.]|nr:hypothetical protein [Ramlibacter sp.]